MNEKIARVGSLIVTITVTVFAVCMLMDFSFGSYFICMILPITGVLRQTADADAGKGGVIALECWCAYFIPVGVLSYIHFGDKHRGEKKGEREK